MFGVSVPIKLTAAAAMTTTTRIEVSSWFGQSLLIAACLTLISAFFGPGLTCAQTTLSPVYQRELEDAEAQFFKGDLDKSLERMRDARNAVRDARKDAAKGKPTMDHTVAESIVDIMEAEVRGIQGYLSTAAGKLAGAQKDLNSRARFYAKNPRLPDSGSMLGKINYRLGYCDVLRGDLAFQKAFVDAVTSGDPITLKRCIDPYENGLQIIRNTWNVTDASDLEIQMRLMNKCDFRFVRILIIKGELDRAMAYYQDAEKLMKLDWVWIVNYAPPSLIIQALDDADRELAKIKEQKERAARASAGQASTGSQSNEDKQTAEEIKREKEREQLRRLQMAGAYSFSAPTKSGTSAIKTSHGDDGLRLSSFERDSTRVAITYMESLSVKSDLNLALAQKEQNPTPALEKAEQAISAARDLAEDKLPGTPFVDEARLQLARVYCKRYQESLRKSTERPDDVVEIDDQLSNVHKNAATTYLNDAREIVELCEQRVQTLNDAHPLRARLLDVRQQLALLSQDSGAIDAVRIAIARFAEKREEDKPPKVD